MKFSHYIIPLASLLAHPVHAQVVVTDQGLSAPTLGINDTGYTGATEQRWGWDTGEGFTQTFTAPSAGIIQSIFIGYNGFDNGETITLDLLVNRSAVASEVVLNGDNFSGSSATDNNDGAFYWMEFDLSSENIPVTAGLNSFSMNATADSGASWALAPRYSNTQDVYSGGAMSLPFSPNTPGDLAFAVTVGAAVTTELKVTSTSFDNEGNFIIGFTGETDTDYEVTKSLALSNDSFVPLETSLVISTDAGGAGQATVPATEAAEVAAFFRLEKRP